jgi:hypothetical protein
MRKGVEWEKDDAHGMMVGNTLFKRAPARLITYRSGREYVND